MRRTVDSGKIKNEVMRYFSSHPEKWESFCKLRSERQNISLRLLEYCVLKFSKMKDVRWIHSVTSQRFVLYNSYREQLRKYRKKNFDPFGRHGKEDIRINGKLTTTNIGQMNFFKWAIQSELLGNIV